MRARHLGFTALLATLALPPALAPAISLNLFTAPATPWQSSDATLGISGYRIFDFESTTLPAGVTVSVSAPAGSYGPTGTIPFLYDPVANDPNAARVLVPGIWDGSHVFVNRLDANMPIGYVDSPATHWGAFTFTFPAGTTSAGFSVEQMELTQSVVVNGSTTFFLQPGQFNIGLGSGTRQNGYLRVDAAPGEFVTSITVSSSNGDGYAIDHLAFAVPEPTGCSILLVAGAALCRRRAR